MSEDNDYKSNLKTRCCEAGFHYDHDKQVHVCDECEKWLCAGDCCLVPKDYTKEDLLKLRIQDAIKSLRTTDNLLKQKWERGVAREWCGLGITLVEIDSDSIAYTVNVQKTGDVYGFRTFFDKPYLSEHVLTQYVIGDEDGERN